MRHLFLATLLFFTLAAIAQRDTALSRTDSFVQQQIHKMDSINTASSIRSMNNNMTYFVSEMQERERKKKQQMWMRFGFAALMITIAIVGLMRRKKQKDQQK